MYIVICVNHDYEYHSESIVANLLTRGDANILRDMLQAKADYEGDGCTWYTVTELDKPTTIASFMEDNELSRFEIYPGEEESMRFFDEFQWESFDPMDEDIFYTNGRHQCINSALETNREYKYWDQSYYANGYPKEIPAGIVC